MSDYCWASIYNLTLGERLEFTGVFHAYSIFFNKKELLTELTIVAKVNSYYWFNITL